MMLPKSVPGVVRANLGGMTTRRDEIRPSRYCCSPVSGCDSGNECWAEDNDCAGRGLYGCNDSHCNDIGAGDCL